MKSYTEIPTYTSTSNLRASQSPNYVYNDIAANNAIVRASTTLPAAASYTSNYTIHQSQ